MLDATGDDLGPWEEDPETGAFMTDILTGGAGNDTFVGGGRDIIMDPEAGDRLVIDGQEMLGGTWQYIGDELIGYDGQTPVTFPNYGYVGPHGEIYQSGEFGELPIDGVAIYDRVGEYINDWTLVHFVIFDTWEGGDLGIEVGGAPQSPGAPFMSPNEELVEVVSSSTGFTTHARDSVDADKSTNGKPTALHVLSASDVLERDDGVLDSTDATANLFHGSACSSSVAVATAAPGGVVSTSADEIALMAA